MILPIIFNVNKKRILWHKESVTGFSFLIFIWVKTLDRTEEQIRKTRDHEIGHFYQQVGLLFILHWILYGIFHFFYGYYNNPFEKAARYYEETGKGKWYSWLKFL